jgi:hypothetical protein
MKVYVLSFTEWGWEEGEENTCSVLGVFNSEKVAKSFEVKANAKNNHGYYKIDEVTIDEFREYGW